MYLTAIRLLPGRRLFLRSVFYRTIADSCRKVETARRMLITPKKQGVTRASDPEAAAEKVPEGDRPTVALVLRSYLLPGSAVKMIPCLF